MQIENKQNNKNKKISIVLGICGCVLSLIALVLAYCLYGAGVVRSDFVYVLCLVGQICFPFAGTLFGIIAAVRKEKSGWVAIVLNAVFFCCSVAINVVVMLEPWNPHVLM